MEHFDLAIAYTWEYDKDFVEAFKSEFIKKNLSTLLISYDNLKEVEEKVRNNDLYFDFYLDRASDVEEEFEPLAKWVTENNVRVFNRYDYVNFAIDKATMHLEFITNGINTPYTIIISPYSEIENIELSLDQLAKLGRPFIIKPANTTGGGIGVVKGAETLADVLKARKNFQTDKYLLQEKIIPIKVDGKRFWFRDFYVLGKVFLCWWNDITHIYDELTDYEIEKYNLYEMKNIVEKIASITKLDFFSTEIALTAENKFVVIDYVNDQCDMRLKSKHIDGVPDALIFKIIDSFSEYILKAKQEKSI